MWLQLRVILCMYNTQEVNHVNFFGVCLMDSCKLNIFPELVRNVSGLFATCTQNCVKLITSDPMH